MSIASINNLPSKFQPFLIGSPNCPANIKNEIDTIFQQPLEPLKSNYIFDAGKWVLKLGRTDGLNTTPDTHLYRVRKAEKIRTFIHQNNLDDHIAVSKKLIYLNTSQNQFYVVAEKMDLSSEVATPSSVENETVLKSLSSLGGQAQALANNAPKRSLTPIQAKTLAELSVLGSTDLSFNNLYFTRDGKVAIIDTEPQKRSLKKTAMKSLFFVLFGDKGALLSQQSLAGIAKLKIYVDNPIALKAVQRVERNHVLWSISKLITKFAVVTLAIYFSPGIKKLVPIAAVATTLKVSFIAVAVLKSIFLITNIVSIYMVWHLSFQGLQGIGQIGNMEMNSIF